MASTSCDQRAQEALARCLRGEHPGGAAELAAECPAAFFGVLVEGLADRFEPRLCDAYARIFAEALGRPELAGRYERVRAPRPCAADPRRVFVLSRVTLGADIAVTSVLLDAVKRRFPNAQIVLVGPKKNAGLFAADPRIAHVEVPYPRGTLEERLGAWPAVRSAVSEPDSIVIDPDSRLTQLGLLPVCDDERYFFFESRAYGAETCAPLRDLAAQWAREVFGIEGARPYMAIPQNEGPRGIAVSLGVGENPGKRMPDPFEEELFRLLGGAGRTIIVDSGAGGEEAARVARAMERSGVHIEVFRGQFAAFASVIARSECYVGYDSAGQHAAAACGVPLISIFAGFPGERFFHRWRPAGCVIRADRSDVASVLAQVKAAMP